MVKAGMKLLFWRSVHAVMSLKNVHRLVQMSCNVLLSTCSFYDSLLSRAALVHLDITQSASKHIFMINLSIAMWSSVVEVLVHWELR